eukprot:scaffold308_cov327-Pavlova_lutheri.AAC.40
MWAAPCLALSCVFKFDIGRPCAGFLGCRWVPWISSRPVFFQHNAQLDLSNGPCFVPTPLSHFEYTGRCLDGLMLEQGVERYFGFTQAGARRTCTGFPDGEFERWTFRQLQGEIDRRGFECEALGTVLDLRRGSFGLEGSGAGFPSPLELRSRLRRRIHQTCHVFWQADLDVNVCRIFREEESGLERIHVYVQMEPAVRPSTVRPAGVSGTDLFGRVELHGFLFLAHPRAAWTSSSFRPLVVRSRRACHGRCPRLGRFVSFKVEDGRVVRTGTKTSWGQRDPRHTPPPHPTCTRGAETTAPGAGGGGTGQDPVR